MKTGFLNSSVNSPDCLPDSRQSFIFAAFAQGYRNHSGENLPGFNRDFQSRLAIAAATIDPVLSHFGFSGETFENDELRTQYLTYIYSSTAAGILRKLKFRPVLTAGYSMGIYAALFDAGSITFASGLELIQIAYQSMRDSLPHDHFSMGTIIGLSGNDLTDLIGNHNLEASISNRNASHSFVVSGYRGDVRKLLELAAAEGALHTRDLGVSLPYHSRLLEQGSLDFARKIRAIGFQPAANPVVSLVDQKILQTPEALRNEVVRNLCCPLNWLNTQEVMVQNGVNMFVECGPSNGLVKNSKFVEGNYRFYTLGNLPPAE